MNPLFKQYVELEAQIKDLESKKEELRNQIIEELDDNGTKFMETPVGSFAIMERTTYEYSPSIQEMEKRIKELKRKEEATGDAFIKTAIRYLRFQALKGGEDAK